MATFPTNVLCNYFVKIDFRGEQLKEKIMYGFGIV